MINKKNIIFNFINYSLIFNTLKMLTIWKKAERARKKLKKVIRKSNKKR